MSFYALTQPLYQWHNIVSWYQHQAFHQWYNIHSHHPNQTPSDQKDPLQLDLTIKCLKDWRISINTGKTVAVLFIDKTSTHIKAIQIHVVGIKWNNFIKYLEVKLDSKLHFSQHVKETCVKAKRTRVALCSMLNHYCTIVPIRVKITILKMYINTILTYADLAWRTLITKQFWRQLEAIKNIALSTFSGMLWYVRNTVIKESINIKTIRDTTLLGTY